VSSAGFVATVDAGSSSVRAMLWDLQGRGARGLEVQHEYTAANEIDADLLARLVIRSLVELVRKAGPRRAERIAAVGMSTFWHGLVAADESKRALTPVYLWSDMRSWSAARHLQERFDAQDVWGRTGCPLHPSYWPAKLGWLREARPDLWRRPVRWLSFGDLLFWRLFGPLGTSLSMASGTGLFRLPDGQWDEELLGELRIEPESLPPIAKAEKGLTPRYARLLPQLADRPWFHAAGDGALANLGSGCTSRSNRAITIGTSGALRVMHGAKVAGLPEGLWRYRLDESRLLTGGALSNGGNLRGWLRTNLRVDSRFRETAPGAHGLTFLPLLFGERSLGYAPDAFGAVAGLTSANTADDVAQAAYEAVAVQFAKIDRALDEILPRPRLLVASGGALVNSPGWMQMIADATGRPTAASRAREASSRGAALFAMEGLGIRRESPEPEVTRVFTPRRQNASAYRQIEARQSALYQALIKDRIMDRMP